MADETPPEYPASDTTPKKETVRITLPSKSTDAPAVKRETVRFNPAPPISEGGAESGEAAPKGQTIRISPLAASPKKETTRVITPPPPSTPTDAPVAAAPAPLPSVPAFSPKPLSSPGALPGMKPLAPLGGPPKAPGIGIKTAPLGQPPKPGGPPAAAAPGAPAVAPAPKKETARIPVPTAQKPALPKATVRMQQTQPLMPMAAPVVTKQAVVTTETEEEPEVSDKAVDMMSIAACVFSLVAAAICYYAYSAISGVQ